MQAFDAGRLFSFRGARLVPTLMSPHASVRESSEEAVTNTVLDEDLSSDPTIEHLEEDLDEQMWEDLDQLGSDNGEDDEEANSDEQ